jgi:hypothetical protein
VPDGKMPGFSRNLGGWDGAVTGRGVEGGAYDREAQAARAALDAAEYLGAGGVPEEWRLLQGRKDVLLDRRRIFARNSDRYFDPALDEGDLRPYWNALARGTVEGPSGATPLDLLAVPPPTAAELRAVGFPPGEAEAQAGGRELLWEESHGYPPSPPSRTKWTRLVHPSVLTGHVSSLSHRYRFWHAHHWYRQHFRNGNVTRAQTRLARAEGARVLQACGLRGAPLCEVCEESPAWELFRNSIWGSGRWSYGRWGGGRGGSAEQAPPPAAAAAAAGLRGGGFDYSRFDALDVSSDSPPSDGARAPPTACATDAELTRGAAGDMDALRSDPASADPDRMIGTLQAIQNMHSKAQSSFEDWQARQRRIDVRACPCLTPRTCEFYLRGRLGEGRVRRSTEPMRCCRGGRSFLKRQPSARLATRRRAGARH